MINKADGCYFIQEEPLVGMSPSEAIAWLSSSDDDQLLADAYAVVSRHTGAVLHLLADSDPWLDTVYEQWYAFQTTIVDRIMNQLTPDEQGHANQVEGYHNRIRPFMLRHGYQDYGGWWRKD